MRTILTAVIVAGALAAGAQTPPTATYKTEADLTKALAASAANPEMLTSAVSIDERHRINVVRRTKVAGAAAHPGFAELHHIIDGSGTRSREARRPFAAARRVTSRRATSSSSPRACRTGTKMSMARRSRTWKCGGKRNSP
jgi:hypothetical protein